MMNFLLFTQKNISSATRSHIKKPGGHTDLLANQTNKLVSSRPARDIISTNRKGGRGVKELRERQLEFEGWYGNLLQYKPPKVYEDDPNEDCK